ncbi:FHA domain-containing protein [Mariniblastus sp.]|nr:FHA domain-containing protein [Mariniblastus sp.]
MATISFTDSNAVQHSFSLEETPVIIGRHPECEIQLDEASVSRYHAKITLDNGHFYVQDLNSRNGTTLNGDAVLKPTRIFDQATIKICDMLLSFSMDEASSGGTLRPKESTAANLDSGKASQHLSSIFLDDFVSEKSSIMSQLDVPSHHERVHNHATAEQKLVALTKITHALSETVERNEVLTKILDFLLELFTNADRGFIILKNAAGDLEPVGWKTRHAADDEQNDRQASDGFQTPRDQQRRVRRRSVRFGAEHCRLSHPFVDVCSVD